VVVGGVVVGGVGERGVVVGGVVVGGVVVGRMVVERRGADEQRGDRERERGRRVTAATLASSTTAALMGRRRRFQAVLTGRRYPQNRLKKGHATADRSRRRQPLSAMNVRTNFIHALRAGPRRTNGLLLLVGVVLALVPLAGRAQAGVGDYPSPLYLSGPASSVTGHASSYQLIGAPSPAPTTSVAAGASTLLAATYAYVYTVDTGSGETASLAASATVTTANSEQITVSGLPTGPTVRLYRMNVTNPTQCYKLVVSLPSNAQTSYTDTNGSATCTGALKRSEDRFPTVTTGWTELSPSTTAPFIGNSPVVGAPAAPNTKGWIVDGAGQVSFPTGPWTFEVQTRSTAPDGAAVLVVAMWKVDSATGNPVGAAVLAPTETVQAPASLITGPNTLQSVTIQTDVPAFSLEANERLYVQFWRHQTTQYAGTTGASNRIATMFAWDGVAKITHPGASGYAVEPTPVAPAAGASTASLALSAVFNDPDPSDSGTVEFRVCTAAAAAGVACGPLVDTGSSPSVAKGATAAWTIAAALTGAATYHWQARGRDALGGTSPWTATQSFRVDIAPDTPAQLAPAAGTAKTSLVLEASYSDPDGDAGSLELRVCTAEAPAGVECAGHVSTGWFNSVVSGERVRWAPGATHPDGVYHWQARAGDVVGATSAWSATRTVRIDTTPPAAPASLAGGVAVDGLTLRWLAPPGGDEIVNYVVYVDGAPWRTLGGQTHEAKVGAFDSSDTRRFSVSAIDAAGNHGPQTSALVGVPYLVGLTRGEARAAVMARGLVLRDETRRPARSVKKQDEVVTSQTPAVPSLVGIGSEVGVVLAPRAKGLLRLVEAGVSCSRPGRLVVQIWLRDRARVSVTLHNRRKAPVASWQLGARADGAHRLTLRFPSTLRPGSYRLFVAATIQGGMERLSRPLALDRAALRGGDTSGSGRPAPRCASAS
jgi:hypothetical protein